MTISHKRRRIVIRKPEGAFTAFRRAGAAGETKLCIYKGSHKTEPDGNRTQLYAINTYSASSQLVAREEFKDGDSINAFEYDYDAPQRTSKLSKLSRSMIPHTRRCIRSHSDYETLCYNLMTGLVESGSFLLNGNLINFSLRYRKNARFLDELLSGEFVMAHLSVSVQWCAPSRRNPERHERWIPYTRVLKASFIQGTDTYESSWSYDHQMHPTVMTKLNGEDIKTPEMIEFNWLGVLKKPKYERFDSEDPLYHANFWNSNWLAKTMGLSVQRIPVSTSMARSKLWKAWKGSKELDGVVVRWLDEKLVRRDRVSKRYWRLRDSG